MIIEVIPIRDGDFEYVKQHCVQEEARDYPDPIIPANTYTCIYDGKIVAVGGIREFLPGVGEAWIMLTAQARKQGIHGFRAVYAIREKLDAIAAELKLRRCEAQVRADFPKGIRLMEALGFSNPYERRGYFLDGTSSLLYERIYGEHRPSRKPGTNLDAARQSLQDAARQVFLEMGNAKTDDQQETLALIEKEINGVEALISDYPKADHEHI